MQINSESEHWEHTNKIIYNPIEGRIEWTENIFSEGSVQKKLVFQDGILKVDNENLNDLIPKNSIPDFAYYLLLSTLNFERKRKYDFTYIDSKTGTLIYNSSLELIRNDIIVIDTNNYNALFIQEQKSNSKANQFWITKEGEILKSDWQGAVSIKANDKKEVCQDLSPRLKELLN